MSADTQLRILAQFAAWWAILAVGHNLADHVLGQTDWQASRKGAPSREDVARGASRHRGWTACLAHVGQYHLVLLTLIAAAWWALPLKPTWAGLTAALSFSAATHALLDRRWPVRWLLNHTRSADFANMSSKGMNGMYLADQALHQTAILVSALLLARL